MYNLQLAWKSHPLFPSIPLCQPHPPFWKFGRGLNAPPPPLQQKGGGGCKLCLCWFHPTYYVTLPVSLTECLFFVGVSRSGCILVYLLRSQLTWWSIWLLAYLFICLRTYLSVCLPTFFQLVSWSVGQWVFQLFGWSSIRLSVLGLSVHRLVILTSPKISF